MFCYLSNIAACLPRTGGDCHKFHCSTDRKLTQYLNAYTLNWYQYLRSTSGVLVKYFPVSVPLPDSSIGASWTMTTDFKPLVLAVLRGIEVFAVDPPTNTMKVPSGFISFSSVNARFPFSTTQSRISSHAQLRPRRKTLQQHRRGVSSTKSECNVATAQHFLYSHGRIFQTLEFKWEVKAGRLNAREATPPWRTLNTLHLY